MQRTVFIAIFAGSTLLALLSPLMADKAADARNRMVDNVLLPAGIKNPRVLDSMRTTLRHEFVPLAGRSAAYFDTALPIGDGQTISPPLVVATMTERLDPQPTDRVLEIGTGSGYQAAVLSPLVKDVYTIEIVKPLGRKAAKTLKKLKYKNVHTRIGDGYLGWPEAAPFDKIIVTCSPEKVPQPLIDQLREGGTIIIPVGQRYQQTLYRFTKTDGQLKPERLEPTLFVPMTGEAEENRDMKPDPSRPKISNGDFEQILKVGADSDSDKSTSEKTEPKTRLPASWHYQRQTTVIDSKESRSGKRFLRFENSQPGQVAQILQGLAVDGRSVERLQISLSIRGKKLHPGLGPSQKPCLAITFYDQQRIPLGTRYIGPWLGNFKWQNSTNLVPVPLAAREAIVRIGLFGSVGQLDVDNLELSAAY
jgi:protein-L-isoaspartate(D-aspartate) O-methyltransferase